MTTEDYDWLADLDDAYQEGVQRINRHCRIEIVLTIIIAFLVTAVLTWAVRNV